MFTAWTRLHGHPAPPGGSIAENVTGTVVVVARGELDIATAPALSELLIGHIAAGITDIGLDTGGLVFCDAAGLGVLVFIEQHLADRGGALRVFDAPPMLRRLLEITDLEFLLAESTGCHPANLAR
ncbi:MAG: STAS domain-containing protein [Acidimicrobiales bacterium]